MPYLVSLAAAMSNYYITQTVELFFRKINSLAEKFQNVKKKIQKVEFRIGKYFLVQIIVNSFLFGNNYISFSYLCTQDLV